MLRLMISQFLRFFFFLKVEKIYFFHHQVLGRGAFGKVMLVEKKDSGEWFAMKTIRKDDVIEKD